MLAIAPRLPLTLNCENSFLQLKAHLESEIHRNRRPDDFHGEEKERLKAD